MEMDKNIWWYLTSKRQKIYNGNYTFYLGTQNYNCMNGEKFYISELTLVNPSPNYF